LITLVGSLFLKRYDGRIMGEQTQAARATAAASLPTQ
jgi:hypothetical protein